MSTPDLDPRWEWIYVPTLERLGKHEARDYIKGECNHLVVVPITSVEGVKVARLCTTCDAQLPPSREP